MDGVEFDGQKMTGVAEGMEADVKKMQETFEDAMANIEKEIGREETGNRAWYGAKAERFVEKVKETAPAFETIHENVKVTAQDLKNQAQAWQDFENRD